MKRFAVLFSLLSFVAFVAFSTVNAQVPVKDKQAKTEKAVSTGDKVVKAGTTDAKGCAKPYPSGAKACCPKDKAKAGCSHDKAKAGCTEAEKAKCAHHSEKDLK